MIDKQNTDRKKKIFPVILLLCVIMGGTGLFYYKNKEDIASTVSKKETVKDRNSISSKKETVNEKNSAVEEYESLENGTNNSFSTYYNGYIYYKKGHVLYRRNMTKSHGMETDIVYYLQDEDANFVIMDGNIYIDDYDETVCLRKLIKKEENSEKETTLSQTEGATYLYTDGEAVYYCTWNDRESSEEGYVERIDKKGEKRELFRIPKEYERSQYHIMDRKYLYYYAADGIKRIDITQKTCNPQLVLKETANQELPDYFYPYNNKIYYTNTYSNNPIWYEYDITTKNKKVILTEAMFGSKGEWFGITNFKGKYTYVQRGSDLYEFSLKTGKLKWLTENYDNYGRNIYNRAWDICKDCLVFSVYYGDEYETGIWFKKKLDDGKMVEEPIAEYRKEESKLIPEGEKAVQCYIRFLKENYKEIYDIADVDGDGIPEFFMVDCLEGFIPYSIMYRYDIKKDTIKKLYSYKLGQAKTMFYSKEKHQVVFYRKDTGGCEYNIYEYTDGKLKKIETLEWHNGKHEELGYFCNGKKMSMEEGEKYMEKFVEQYQYLRGRM